MAKVIKNKVIKLTPIEELWDQAEEKSKTLIVRILHNYIPLDWRPQDLDLEKDTNWRVIARDDIPRWYEDAMYDEEGEEKNNTEDLPSSEYLAEQISYHYLLDMIKGMLGYLADLDCHDSAWFEQLLNPYEN